MISLEINIVCDVKYVWFTQSVFILPYGTLCYIIALDDAFTIKCIKRSPKKNRTTLSIQSSLVECKFLDMIV